MSTSTTSRGPDQDLDTPLGGTPLSHGSLPRRAPQLTIVAALVVGIVLWQTGMSVGLAGVLAVVGYTIAIYVWSRIVEGRRKATNRLVTAIVYAAFLLALLPLVSVIFTVLSKGLPRFDAEFFSFSMRGVVGEGGGAYHAIMGTLIITALATVISVPVGMLTAIYLVEYGKGKLAKWITFFVDVMTGIPSIVAGLFAYALFALIFGPGVRMGIMGAVALSVLMIPVVVRSTEEMLKLVPNELREASYALAVPKWRTIVKVVLPTALAGIATGVTLAIARVIGETAPLLITVGITSSDNFDPFDGRMATLSVFSYYEYVNPGVPPQPALDRAWAAALVLIILVMALNLIARLISRLFAPKTRG
ncbi:phosphate ABC transporter membrane protein 2, PhoT family [Amycolatopsis marina]|uniref:Phosphate transport system permease protein PstA n=1 Tax=Amycolatopsis marina TaxID=490629 RepID=A0A1I0VEL1_9PSEU|nr:phosphate ABC transporter permease PstA [Amycolatopsis marina]SFA74761.1 phosphate ABC transporter membrane protein 2, PhoT family [Amycolatopsis marina]